MASPALPHVLIEAPQLLWHLQQRLVLRQILLDHAHLRLILLVALHSRRMDTWDSPPLFSHWGKEPSPDHAASSIARRPIRSSLSCSCLSTCSSALLAAHAPIKPNVRASATCPRPQQGPSGIGREDGVGPDARKEHPAQLLATHGLAPWTFGGSRGVRVIKHCGPDHQLYICLHARRSQVVTQFLDNWQRLQAGARKQIQLPQSRQPSR